MASGIVEKVQEFSKQIMPVLIQLLDNNAYEWLLPYGDVVLPLTGKASKFHAPDKLWVISKDIVRDHFEAAHSLEWAALTTWSCWRPFPVTFGWLLGEHRSHYKLRSPALLPADVGRALMEMSISLKKMIFMGKLRDITILNPSEALGIIPGSGSEVVGENLIIDLWVLLCSTCHQWVLFCSTCHQLPTN